MSSFNIVLIGSGNVATHLGLELKKAKHSIVQVYSKKATTAKALASTLKCSATNKISAITPDADIYIIAVKDDAIAEVASQLHVNNKIVVHTSGSIPLDYLKTSSNNIGVFYPLQTFSKTKKIDFKSVPVCIEANNKKTLISLQKVAQSISDNVLEINSEQRLNIHIAAVFACNFSNHMYSIANELLEANGLKLDLIKPLITETAEKIKHYSPSEMQTGPAVRNDKKTMLRHLNTLSDKDYKKLYKLISSSIQKTAAK